MESKKVLVITSGGTIGSLLESDQISINSVGEANLAQELRELAAQAGISIDIQKTVNVPSGSLAPEDWGVFSKTIAERNSAGFERFVITHGTDTLHYTAAFLAIQFAGWPIRICLTGAFFPINHDRSDGSSNFVSAFRAASDHHLPSGVYICFPGSIGIVPALAIIPPYFDEVRYRILYDQVFEDRKASVHMTNKIIALRADIATAEELRKAKRNVLFSRLYPGMDMRIFEWAAEGAFLILEGFHSGTGPTGEGTDSLLALRRNRPDLTICIGSIPSPVVTVPYEASTKLATNGIWVYKDIPPHILYVGALLGKAQGLDAADAMLRFSTFRL
jgi:glutamyl-tRNA(Gln) amidotransferase subunit D